MRDAVVDTNIISYIFRGDSRSQEYIPLLAGKDFVVSFMTLAELHRWALIRNWSQRRRDKLHENLNIFFEIYHSNDTLSQKWADVVYQSRKVGRTIETSDAWIAATALMLDLPLITHNKKDFEHLEGIILLSK